MIPVNLVGLPLPDVLDACEKQGIQVQVMYTRAPRERAQPPIGTPRVIAIRGECLIVAYFRDGDPEGTHAPEE